MEHELKHSNDELKRKTRRSYNEIASSFDPKGSIVNKLFAESIITISQVKEINGGHEKEGRAETLLFHLFQTEHPSAFVVFRETLQKDYDWIVKMIDECEGRTNFSILFTETI